MRRFFVVVLLAVLVFPVMADGSIVTELTEIYKQFKTAHAELLTGLDELKTGQEELQTAQADLALSQIALTQGLDTLTAGLTTLNKAQTALDLQLTGLESSFSDYKVNAGMVVDGLERELRKQKVIFGIATGIIGGVAVVSLFAGGK